MLPNLFSVANLGFIFCYDELCFKCATASISQLFLWVIVFFFVIVRRGL